MHIISVVLLAEVDMFKIFDFLFSVDMSYLNGFLQGGISQYVGISKEEWVMGTGKYRHVFFIIRN
jgi:hypothetical protein